MTGTRRKTGSDVPVEDLLSTSPFEGDLAEELAAGPPPRRKPPTVTLALAAGVLLVAGFIGGVQADKQWGQPKQPNLSDLINQFAARGGGQRGTGTGFGGTGQPGAFGPTGGTQTGGNATTGTIKLVDGDVIYVQTANGIVRVQTTDSTKVGIARSATAEDLKTGAPVVVQGTPGQDGTVTATSVTQGR